MDAANHYRSLMRHSETIMESMLSDREALEALTVSHNYLLDFDQLKLAVAGRPEVKSFDAGVKEYQFALFALAAGQYRHAFVGLRLFFELMLVTVQFSAHEIEYRMWAKDSKDINWNALKDPQSGVFSVNFINAFNPGFSESSRQYLSIAEAVYRECSEFVHGNAGTHASLPSSIVFNKDVCLLWKEKAETIRLLIVFVFSARYLNYVSTEARDSMEPLVLDAIGHLPAAQAAFDKPSGE